MMGKGVNDEEFRELLYPAIEKVSAWSNWVELCRDTRPPLTFEEIRLRGASKWLNLNGSTVEKVNAIQSANQSGHDPRNC